MSKKAPKAKAKATPSKIAFVRAGIEGGEVFHVEAETVAPDASLLHLLEAGLTWAWRKTASPEKRTPPFFSLPKAAFALPRPPASSAPKFDGGQPPQTSARVLSILQGLGVDGFPGPPLGGVGGPASTPPSGTQDADLLKNFGKEEKDFYATLDTAGRRAVLDSLHHLRSGHTFATPLRFRVLNSALPIDLKRRVIQKLERQPDSLSGGGDAVKYCTWVEGLLGIPLGVHVAPKPMTPVLVRDSMLNAASYLDSVVYGHKAAKQAILERFYMWLKHPFVPQRPLAFKGVPGNGKTSLVREGLAVIMSRPFNFVALGGSFDSSFLLGHSYTYEGSAQGRLAEALSASGSMNPILFFDEVDKCSATAKGDEVVNVLVHITDTTQSSHFRDRYLNGLDLDVSKALMVFAFNDESKVSPVLLDRFQVVHMDVFDAASQVKILKDYLLPRVLDEHGLARDFLVLSPGALQEAAGRCVSGGVREVRCALEQVVCKACILQETANSELLHPLEKLDLRALSPGCYELRGGLGRMLEAGRKNGTNGAPPPGMYT